MEMEMEMEPGNFFWVPALPLPRPDRATQHEHKADSAHNALRKCLIRAY